MIPQLLNSKMLNDVGGGYFTVTIINPLIATYVGLPVSGTKLVGGDGNDKVLSIQPNADAQVRDKGTAGAYEKCIKQNGLLVWNPNGLSTFAIPFVEVK